VFPVRWEPSVPYGDAVVVVVASLAQPEWEGNGPKQILFVRKGSHTKAVTHTQRLLQHCNKGKLT